jgi:lysophospholipase
LTDAPFFTDVADGPADGRAVWLHAEDGVRIRVAVWPGGDQGTVLLLPGRTEYIEKYGRAARDLLARGFTTVSIDWRGQGIADRALPDKMSGHVDDFSEYQKDLDALLKFSVEQNLPRPFFILGHSMGGCIGLRALMRSVPVQAVAFTAPMWGISMAAFMRPLALTISTTALLLGQKRRYAPGTTSKSYVLEAPFANNVLTTDPDMYAYMRRQIGKYPQLAVAGPSMGWLHAALLECRALSTMAAPDTPALCALGPTERVVDTTPIYQRMRAWPKGRLDLYPGAEHEIMMENAVMRQRLFDSVAAHFRSHT